MPVQLINGTTSARLNYTRHSFRSYSIRAHLCQIRWSSSVVFFSLSASDAGPSPFHVSLLFPLFLTHRRNHPRDVIISNERPLQFCPRGNPVEASNLFLAALSREYSCWKSDGLTGSNKELNKIVRYHAERTPSRRERRS